MFTILKNLCQIIFFRPNSFLLRLSNKKNHSALLKIHLVGYPMTAENQTLNNSNISHLKLTCLKGLLICLLSICILT